MTMAIHRRPTRKSEVNLNNVLSIDASPRPHNCSGPESATGATKERRHRIWSWFLKSSSTPSSRASFDCRPTLSRRSLNRLKSYIKRANKIHLVTFGILATFALVWYVNFVVNNLVGPRGSVKGGWFGDLIDKFSRDYTRYKTITKWREEVQTLHLTPGQLSEPWYFPFDVIIRTRPNYAVVEMLLREKRRVQKLGSMARATEKIQKQCAEDDRNLVYIPKTVLQLLPRREQPTLLPYWIIRSGSIDADSIAILDSDTGISSSQVIKNCKAFVASLDTRSIDTDSLCVAHHLGGMQLSNSYTLHQSRPRIGSIFSLIGLSKTNESNYNLGGGTCNSRLGYAVFSNVPTPDGELRKTSSVSSRVSTVFAAFPPDHPGSLCIPPIDQTIGISPYNEANEELNFRSTFVNRLLAEIETRNFNSTTSVWGIATLPCGYDYTSERAISNCCSQVSVTILESLDGGGIAKHLDNEDVHANVNKQNHHLIFSSSTLIPRNEKQISGSQSNSVSIKISERPSKVKPDKRQKEPIQAKLRNLCGGPGWFCNRCLQSSIYGSFFSCASVCSKCAANVICNEAGTMPTINRVKIDVQVTGNHFPPSNKLASNLPQQNRIPRIIHQTYFEEITIEKYPNLFRLQNSWKASGWDYRFYTDDTARQYVETNFPARFVSVFDALSPGAYKADFFRYLVLFKEGGLYVDVDVMLNANLDNFITPDLAFFAPLDAVGNFADEPFCVWNGLLGSAPAHPALTNVIQWMVNLVTYRADMYDMESAVCSYSGTHKIENWKVRAEPGLMLSGPCALGLAINNALGNEPLAKFRTGLLKREGFNEKNIRDLNSDAVGNVMFLLADKDDLGAMRFSDPERNNIIASTELSGLSKSPMEYETENGRGEKGLRLKPHYSVSTRGQQIWGTHDVYADDLAVHEEVSLIVSHE